MMYAKIHYTDGKVGRVKDVISHQHMSNGLIKINTKGGGTAYFSTRNIYCLIIDEGEDT
jgi:hypothetical protein